MVNGWVAERIDGENLMIYSDFRERYIGFDKTLGFRPDTEVFVQCLISRVLVRLGCPRSAYSRNKRGNKRTIF